MRSVYGDTHNFGRRVESRADGYVYKPRPIVWEWLLLSSESLTRSELDLMFKDKLKLSPFQLYPSLQFRFHTANTGAVEYCQPTQKKIESLDGPEAYLVGLNIALLMWLGIDDLHYENMIIDRDGMGSLRFFPIDIETIFQDLVLPSQTLLIPSNAISLDLCGMAHMIKECQWSNNALAAICAGYWDGLATIGSWRPQIYRDLAASSLTDYDHRVRVILRSSREYTAAMRDSTNSISWESYLECEKVQMTRGDIPYFFVEEGATDLRYFAEPNLAKSVDVRDSELRKPIDRLRSPSNFCLDRHPEMSKFGVLQLAKVLFPLVQMEPVSCWNQVEVAQKGDLLVVTVGEQSMKTRLVKVV